MEKKITDLFKVIEGVGAVFAHFGDQRYSGDKNTCKRKNAIQYSF